MAFFVFVRFKVKSGRVQDFLKELEIAAKSTRTEIGCIQYEYAIDAADENAVILFEKYIDQPAFEVHRSMDYLKSFRAKVTELFDGEPLIIRGEQAQI
ncbi:MAG: antibiotic biosynthesis monooxygenase [Actinobacteria bacterium]|jgi:quinol monooxygenase YgiN|nr:antibiotic biosynthesis monooxygenase [Actinomycetota bacterium]